MLRRIIRRVRRIRQSRETAAPPGTAPVQRVAAPESNPEPEPEPETEPDIELETEDLQVWLDEGRDVVLLDIREPHEIRSGHAAGAMLLRMNDIPNRVDELPDKSTTLVVYCAAGARSYGVTHWLREQGWADAWSLSTGFSGAVDAGVERVVPGEESAAEPEAVEADVAEEPEAVDPKAAEMAEKAARHFEKTRMAMLKLIVDQGGEASLADMHAHSERRYFIAHKRFSDLMESLVDDGLIDFDHGTGMAAISSAGADLVSE